MNKELRQKRAIEVLRKLKDYYGEDIKPFLNHKNAFELLIATILSAQSTDKQINKVTPKLFRHYPTPSALAEADIEDVKELIHSTGFYNNKSKHIMNCAKKLVEDFDSKVPDNIEDLISLPGVGRKTANVVLGQFFEKYTGIAVDTHVRRLAKVLGLSKHNDPDKIEKDLKQLFPREEWNYISLALIKYGREFCTARRHDEGRCFLGHKANAE